MNKNPQHNQQSKSEVEKICIYQKMKVAITASIFENKYLQQLVGSMPENPQSQKIQTICESSHVQ